VLRVCTLVVVIGSACGDSGLSGSITLVAADGFTEGANGSSVFGQGADVLAGFYAAPPADGIQFDQVGPCEIAHNPAPHPPSRATTTYRFYSAGKIEITGGTRAIVVMPNVTAGIGAVVGSYDEVDVQGPLFSGGETLAVHASGDGGLGRPGFPAFTSTLVMPPKLTITAPAKQGLVIDRTQDFTVTWTPVGDQQLKIELMQPIIFGPSVDVVCSFLSSDGAGTIPAAALAALPSNGIFNAWSSTLAERGVDGGTIYVSAIFRTVWPDDTIVNAQFELK
jgi:hypothetical protein